MLPSHVQWRWVIWILLSAISSFGITRFHVDNSLDAWVPDQLAGTDMGSYLIVGFNTGEASIGTVRDALRDLPEVGFCLDAESPMIETILQIRPRGLLLSQDGTYAGILCIAAPETDPAHLTQAIRKALEGIPSTPITSFALAGPAAFASALNDYTQRRMGIIITLIVFIGGGLMGALTHSLTQAIQSIAAIMLSLVILLGAIGWSGVRIDMSMLLVPPMMISLGFSYAAHSALRNDAKRVLMLCALTTILGIIFFSTSGVPSIRMFAFWGAIGVALVWASVLTLVSGPGSNHSRLMIGSGLNRGYRRLIYQLSGRPRWVIMLIGTAIALLVPLGANHLAINPQPLNYFPSDAQIVKDNAIIESNLSGMLPFEIITDDVASVRSIITGSKVVRTVADISVIRADQINPGEHVLWCMSNNDALDSLPALFDEWRLQAHAQDISIQIRGVAAQLLEVRHQMKRIAAISIPSMLLVAAVVCVLIAGNLRAGAAGLIVNLLPISIVLLIAEIGSMPMQLPTLMVGAIGIGAGIDDTIHILWLKRHGSTPKMLATCLIPCLMSSFIAGISMALFVLSPFAPTAQFGMLMAIILLIASLSDLVFFPIMY